MSDDFVWLQHEGHGGIWKCPKAAVHIWLPLGWSPCEAPVEPNPVFEQQPEPTPESAPPAASTSRRVAASTTSTEGTD